jgi:hypothetical protein
MMSAIFQQEPKYIILQKNAKKSKGTFEFLKKMINCYRPEKIMQAIPSR